MHCAANMSVKIGREQRQTADRYARLTKVISRTTHPSVRTASACVPRKVRATGEREVSPEVARRSEWEDLNGKMSSLKERMSTPNWLKVLNHEIVACTRCPRLVKYREQIAQEKRRAYRDWEYWGKPVPGFGDPAARVLILGLAPGAHGSNRTGRPFTGDASGNFMYPVLYETGFANQPTATDRDDGLVLTNLYITAAARCAPPDNKPLPEELTNCAPYLERELEGLENLRVIVALGRIGFDSYLNYLMHRKLISRKREYVFQHGAEYTVPDSRMLLASYHPSNQNTQTGKLTKVMFRRIFQRAREVADESKGRILA